MADDIKSGSYNAILLDSIQWGRPDASSGIKERLDFSPTYSLSECEKAYYYWEREERGIIDNIIYSGLIVKTDKVLQGRCKKNEKESI